VFVKVCGLSTAEDVATAVDAGADAVGFVLTTSPRRVDAGLARELVASAPPGVLTVAVFRGEPATEIAATALDCGVAAVQLHGDYSPADYAALRRFPLRLVRAASATGDRSLRGDSLRGGSLRCGDLGEDLLLVDSPTPGSGQTWDWGARDVRPEGHWLLAGGLRPDNVAEAVRRLTPWGVDVSSGVERARGVKDHTLIRAFVSAAKSAAPTW
jgi:phosphoribosylanthranilate isomerase